MEKVNLSDELLARRIMKNLDKIEGPGKDLWVFVFEEALKKPWCNSPDKVDPELAKAIVYETLKLVAEYLDQGGEI